MSATARSYTVVGAARSGIAAANALAARAADVLLVELNPDKARPEELHPDVAYRAGTNEVRPGDVAVLSPGIKEVAPVRQTIAAAASEVIGEVELFYRLRPPQSPVLAITGTDGKSTVTTMLGAIVAESGRPVWVGGNLGNPLCTGLDDITPATVVVAEVSCFQLTTCVDFRPRVAVVANITEDHIDYHGGFDAYQAAKRRVWRRMTPDDVLITNADDAFIADWSLPAHVQLRAFSGAGDASSAAYFQDDALWLAVDGEPVELMTRDELPLLGVHNVANALAASLAAASFGIEPEAARRALASYQTLPHRIQTVRELDGVLWINDSKATNPNAARAGLAAMERPTVLLAGGSEKEADFTAFGELVRAQTRHAFLFGQTRYRLAEAIGPDHPTTLVETIDEAVLAANAFANPGDVVLLSPACASFDQFSSYGHRGDVFMELVRAL